MRMCPECRTRAMRRHEAENKVYFVCPCGAKIEGRPEDRLIETKVVMSSAQAAKYSTYLANAASSRTTLRVEKECPGCGLPYLTQSRVGPEETIVFTCGCGYASAS